MKTLVLTFKNEEGQNASLRLRYPKDGLTPGEINTLMDTIIQKNIFATSGGDLVQKVGAQIVESNTTTVSLE